VSGGSGGGTDRFLLNDNYPSPSGKGGGRSRSKPSRKKIFFTALGSREGEIRGGRQYFGLGWLTRDLKSYFFNGTR